MDERTKITLRSENDGPSCAIDKSCCGGASEAELVDVGCTLNPAEMPERVQRWQALFGQMLGYEHRLDHAVFRFAQSEGLDGKLRELVKLEQVCCAHVSWGLKMESNQVLLTLKAEPEALGALVCAFTGGFGGTS
jgi:hypothetical protein|tara:strand:- start:251 stop:655 length:405 start_codon:yes stop_codon:yes gene_type:complete